MQAPPPSSNGVQLYTPHAISRSAELLSVARTSLRILASEEDDSSSHIQSMNANSLSLHDKNNHPSSNTALEALEEATLTLNLLDSTLKTLSNLVKRRGTTNDPTEEINKCMTSFHNYSKGLLEILQNSLPQASLLSPFDEDGASSSSMHGLRARGRNRSSSMRVKHYETVANVLKIKVEKRMEEFKAIMAVRGNVIKDLTLRRKQLLNVKRNEKGAQFSIGSTTNGYVGGAGTVGNSVRPMPPPRPPPTSGGFRSGGGGNGITPVVMEKRAKSQLNSPLFTMSHQQKSKSKAPSSLSNGAGGRTSTNNTIRNRIPANGVAEHPEIGGYGGVSSGYGAGGYGGGYGGGGSGNPYSYAASKSNSSTGMRRRAAGSTTNAAGTAYTQNQNGVNNANDSAYNPYQEDENKVHDNNSVQAQIQMRRQTRQTQKRLESARQAEKTLAELTNMFSKMSNLIHSQGETLVKIEDDVEAAMDHVEAGKEEIDKLNEWTKGNRGLIIKMFALMIFFIIFMKFYG
uniref:t-SNARE coiled-coil homology domain-containing protein n=2 Tax=Chaetoceros debilis TaxID=122233 RepID=A0A7S3QHK3_9STRA